MSVYEYSVVEKNGNEKSLKDYEGKVLLIVNTASKCGFTPQYEGLEALYKEYKDQGLEIIGIPANEFGAQEPGTNDEVQHFCKVNYGVTFQIMAKAVVQGEDTIPLVKYLTSQQGFKGFSGEKADFLANYIQENYPAYWGNDSIKWNFTKFLINKKGDVVARFEPTTEPADMKSAIEAELAK